MSKEKDLIEIKRLLDGAENNILQAKRILFSNQLADKAKKLDTLPDSETIEGIFNGEDMLGKDKTKYPVPLNYASKSKLIPGDVLKLTIEEDGSYLYKQIGPIKRKKAVGELEEAGDDKYVVNANGKKYQVNKASITYFKALPGDKMTIIIPEKGESEWAAVENLINQGDNNEN